MVDSVTVRLGESTRVSHKVVRKAVGMSLDAGAGYGSSGVLRSKDRVGVGAVRARWAGVRDYVIDC